MAFDLEKCELEPRPDFEIVGKTLNLFKQLFSYIIWREQRVENNLKDIGYRSVPSTVKEYLFLLLLEAKECPPGYQDLIPTTYAYYLT